MEDYNITISINASADRVFKALTEEIPQWWTEMFQGSSSNEGDSFTVRFGEEVFKTMQATELADASKVVWLVEDSLINIPVLSNQKEWIGTRIVWTIEQKENNTELHLVHFGLHPEIECYEICSLGWHQFTDSLKSYLETGTGKPFQQE